MVLPSFHKYTPFFTKKPDWKICFEYAIVTLASARFNYSWMISNQVAK